jgi:hypothetical protein
MKISNLHKTKIINMKKIVLFLFVFALSSISFAQAINPSSFVSNYNSYKGKSVVLNDVSGTISAIPHTSTKAGNDVAVNTQTTVAPSPGKKSSFLKGPKKSKKTTNNLNSSTCEPKAGFKTVEFTFSKGQNCGCFIISDELIPAFNTIKNSGKKMSVTVSVDLKTNYNQIIDVSQI